MSSIKNMTSGTPWKLILAYGLPLLFGNILQQLYNFVDTVVVGRGISVDALAAVGSTGSLNFLVLGFVIGTAQGVSILVSQYFGANDYQKMKKAITMSGLLCLVTGVVLTILSVWQTRNILILMQTPADILDDAVLYIQLIFYGILIQLAYNFLSGILRALGDSRNPLVAMVIAFIFNTVLDIWFVMGLHWGVAGAALATLTAQGVSAIYCAVVLLKLDMLRLHREDFALDWDMLKKSAGLSYPVAFMNSITAVGVMVLQAVLNTFGAVAIAAYSAANKVIVILEQISSTFGFATGTFVGQNLGAGKIERIKSGVRQINFVVILINVSVSILVLALGRPLMALMIGGDAEVIDMAYYCLWLCSVFLAALGILWVYRCALQSMGDTVFPMYSGFVELAARIAFILTLPKLLGLTGVMLSEVSAWISAAIFLVAVYVHRMRSGKLASIKI